MLPAEGERWVPESGDGPEAVLRLTTGKERIEYALEFESSFATQIRIELSLQDEDELFHLIPCNIHGDNNLAYGRPGEFPNLTTESPQHVSCAPLWEFRADRASHPVSILCCSRGAVGISIEPYAEGENGELTRNGLFCALPNRLGVSLGYTNDPVTFINHLRITEEGLDFCMDWEASSRHRSKRQMSRGRIFGIRGAGRESVHPIIRELYLQMADRAVPEKPLEDAAAALLDTFLEVNYSKEHQNYTNMECRVPDAPQLKAWRPLVEIGWTGGGVIAYPLLIAREALGMPESIFDDYKSPESILQDIVDGYNQKSGLLFDVVQSWSDTWPESRVNGWWSGFHLAENCHTAYANGSALYYLFKTLNFMKAHQQRSNEAWQAVGCRVLNTVQALQREDGAFGYTYSESERRVLDWEGFAGCWFVPAFVLAFRITGNDSYLDSAVRAVAYYAQFVSDLNCWGTPMDTWKSVDEEGNLAFIKGVRLLHQATGDPEYLRMLEQGAYYEYLWRYGFNARPEWPPLKNSGWRSCGGSITSVSNPHMHPMALLVTDDLEYLADATGDEYHRQRAEDAVAWAMATMELYPAIMGYGRYGVFSERFCPSDGLTIERYSDGTPSSTWFSYNGWAAANLLEALAERILTER